MNNEIPSEFEKVISILNEKDINHLWLISCICSLLEFHSGYPERFTYVFPVMNHSRSILFTKAVLYSKSDKKANGLILQKDIAPIFNHLANCSNRIDFFEDDTLSDEEKMLRLFSSAACSQFWFLKGNIGYRIGFLIAIFDYIPKKFKSELESKHKNNFIDISQAIADTIGITLENYFLMSLYIFNAYRRLTESQLQPDDKTKSNIESLENDVQACNLARQRFFEFIIINAQNFYNEFIFKSEYLEKIFPFIDNEEINAFLSLTSCNTNAIRSVNSSDYFQRGHISDRLNPLERYPIINLENNSYIVPNMRYFDIACTELLHYELQNIYKDNQYNEVMGSVQELYINELINHQMDDLVLINEQTYEKNNSEYKGPDFTIIENDRLIVIESKSKMITLDTRLQFYSETLLLDLDSSIEALLKLENEKIPDLFIGEKVYCHFQDQIDKTKHNKPICIVVIRKGIISMQEIVNIYCRNNKEYKLNQIKNPFCIIDIEHFTLAVDIAKSNNIKLYDLLFEYWEIGKVLDPKPSSAEEFGGRSFDRESSFVGGFFNNFIKSARKKKK